MNERLYNFLANLFLVIALASAYLFDSGLLSHMAAGTIGIFAGVGAIWLYFYNQKLLQDKSN